MKPTDLITSIQESWQAGLVPMLHGDPGIGKSDVIRQAAMQYLGVDELTHDNFRDNRASTMDPVDVRGLPTIIDGVTKWNRPDLVPSSPKGVLFWDELNRAAPSVQSSLLQVMLERHLGDFPIPDGIVQAAAGNRDGTGNYVTKLDGALSTRFAHLDFDVDLDDWSRWANTNEVLPEIIAFVRFRPELHCQYDKSKQSNPNPRSWTFASNLLKQTPSKDRELEMLSGVVGEGAATECIAFLKIYRNLPSPDAVLLDPKGATVPDDPATRYAITGALARKASPDNFDSVTQYLARLPDEFSVMGVRDAINHNPDIQTTKAFINWAADNSSVLI